MSVMPARGPRSGKMGEARVNVVVPGMVRTVRVNVDNVPSYGP